MNKEITNGVKLIEDSLIILKETVNEIEEIKNSIIYLDKFNDSTIDGYFNYYLYSDRTFKLPFKVSGIIFRLESELKSLQSKKDETIANIMRLLEEL